MKYRLLSFSLFGQNNSGRHPVYELNSNAKISFVKRFKLNKLMILLITKRNKKLKKAKKGNFKPKRFETCTAQLCRQIQTLEQKDLPVTLMGMTHELMTWELLFILSSGVGSGRALDQLVCLSRVEGMLGMGNLDR